MKRIKTAGLLGVLLIGTTPAFAAIPAATVTATFDKTTHTLSPSGKSEIAGVGTVLRDGEYLKTGKASLAELELANKTITRLGPNTLFAYSATTREADLQSGTILFSKPKDGKELTIKTSTVTAAVTGTTGFVEKEGASVIFGVIEGTVHLTVGSAHAILQAGKMLVSVPGSNPQVVSFDVPGFVSTSAFFHRFQQPLPNEKQVEQEVVEYHDLVSRGFIEPVKAMLAPADRQVAVAANRIVGHDAAGNPTYASVVTGASLASAGSSRGGASGGFAISGASLNAGGASGITVNGGASFGGAGVTQAGAGTLTLSGANTYSGGTTISSGTLSALAANGSTVSTSGSGAILTVNGNNTYSGGTTIYNGTLIGSSGTGTINTTIGGTLTTGTPTGGLTITGLGGTGTTTLGGILTTGGTLTNTTGNTITVGGVTVPPHGSVTIPPAHG